MTLRLLSTAVLLLALLAATPAEPEPVPVPFLSAAELKCQKKTFTATVDYLQKAFSARQSCFDKVTRGVLPPETNCRAPVDIGTGDDATDDAISSAEAGLAVAIQTNCLNVQLERLGYPGLCEDPFGPPYDTFDHEQCLLDLANSTIDRLLEIEHPPFPGRVEVEDHTCQDDLARKSSSMFVKEIEARTVLCEQKRLELAIDPSVNCRAEIDPLSPGTGDSTADERIIDAHQRVLRGVANSCRLADLSLLGFPHMCPNPEDSVFSIAALTKCMYETHHFGLVEFIDTLVPLTKLCGNCVVDGDSGEECDDGDNAWRPGQVCRANCSLISTCGDTDDSGGLTVRDALFILRAAVGLEQCELALCDVSGDGVINTTDALLILRAVVGLPVELMCSPPEPPVCPAA